MSGDYPAGQAGARALDAADQLASFRDRFHVPVDDAGRDVAYFCGNSLGLQPVTTRSMLDEELDDWRTLAVKGHFDARRPWLPYHELLTDKMATVVGADPLEVVCMNSLTVNLHLLMASFYRPTAERFRLLIEAPAFPSDHYAVASQARFHGFDPDQAVIVLRPRVGEPAIRDDDVLEAIDRHGPSLALVMLPGVQYYNGQAFDLAAITAAAHRQGAQVGFDLAHAAGNLELALHDWGCDFAAWCSYKYLNSGPGSIAGAFVHARHATADLPRFAGWWGHDKTTRFKMGPDFVPIPGAQGWQLSNPPIFAMTPLLASLEVFAAAGLERLRRKSIRLTGYFEHLVASQLGEHVEVLTPSEPSRRGCQLSLRVRAGADRGRAAFEALDAAGVICDWREPDVIRAAPVPLYNRFEDCWRLVSTLREALVR